MVVGALEGDQPVPGDRERGIGVAVDQRGLSPRPREISGQVRVDLPLRQLVRDGEPTARGLDVAPQGLQPAARRGEVDRPAPRWVECEPRVHDLGRIVPATEPGEHVTLERGQIHAVAPLQAFGAGGLDTAGGRSLGLAKPAGHSEVHGQVVRTDDPHVRWTGFRRKVGRQFELGDAILDVAECHKDRPKDVSSPRFLRLRAGGLGTGDAVGRCIATLVVATEPEQRTRERSEDSGPRSARWLLRKQRESALVGGERAVVVALRPAQVTVARVKQRDTLSGLLGHRHGAVDERLRARKVAAQLSRLGGSTKELDPIDSLGELRCVGEPERTLILTVGIGPGRDPRGGSAGVDRRTQGLARPAGAFPVKRQLGRGPRRAGLGELGAL